MIDIAEITIENFFVYAPASPLHRPVEAYRTDEAAGAIVVGAVLLDLVDKDWSWVVLTKLKGTFRAIDLGTSCATPEKAREQLHASMRQHARTS